MNYGLKENAIITKMEEKPSLISGHGTFAKLKISRGEFLMALTGTPFTTEELNKIYSGNVPDDPLQIGDELYLVLNHSSKVINHSCDPNAGLRNISDLYALKDIAPGEEITYDYSTTVGVKDNWNMPCKCGAKNCRKKIGNVLSLTSETLNKYFKLNAFQDYIKKQTYDMKHLSPQKG